MNHYRCPVCETDVRLTPDVPVAGCPCGLVHMERQEWQTAIYLRRDAYGAAPAPPAPIVAAVLTEQAAALVRLETDLLLARARITKLEQRLDQHQGAGNDLAQQLVRMQAQIAGLDTRNAALEADTVFMKRVWGGRP